MSVRPPQLRASTFHLVPATCAPPAPNSYRALVCLANSPSGIANCQLYIIIYYWCCSRNRSFTVFTGLNVSSGTSTKMVFQLLIAPFQRPGSSSAFSSLPLLLL